MGLLSRIRRGRGAPVIARPDPQCRGTTRTGRRCKLPAGPDGFCGVFHHPGPRLRIQLGQRQPEPAAVPVPAMCPACGQPVPAPAAVFRAPGEVA